MSATLYRCLVKTLLVGALGIGLPVALGWSQIQVEDEKKTEIPFWDLDRGFQVRAAVALLGAGNPWNALSTRMAISENQPTVAGWDFVFDKALPLDRHNLDLIKDGRPLPDRSSAFITDMPVPDRGFYRAYLQALRLAHWSSLEMLENSGNANKHVVYADLASAPKRYRGDVIAVRGKAELPRKVNPPTRDIDRADLNELYTAFIVGPTKGVPPFVAVFPELPRGVKDFSDLADRDVTFYGYFLGMVRFPADKDSSLKKDLLCPYLVGKTLLVQPRAREPESSSYSYPLIIASFGGIVAVVLLGAVVMLWFRRSDRKIRSQLQEVRDKHQPFTLEPDNEPPPPI